jgi:hypothetical protein
LNARALHARLTLTHGYEQTREARGRRSQRAGGGLSLLSRSFCPFQSAAEMDTKRRCGLSSSPSCRCSARPAPGLRIMAFSVRSFWRSAQSPVSVPQARGPPGGEAARNLFRSNGRSLRPRSVSRGTTNIEKLTCEGRKTDLAAARLDGWERILPQTRIRVAPVQWARRRL